MFSLGLSHTLAARCLLGLRLSESLAVEDIQEGSLKQLLTAWHLAPKRTILRVSVPGALGRSCNTSCDLTSEIPEHHFHYILLVK